MQTSTPAPTNVIYTGKTLTLAIRSTYGATLGWFNIGPITGILRKNVTIRFNTSPNKNNIPTDSMAKPMKACFRKIIKIPTAKHTVPLSFDGRRK